MTDRHLEGDTTERRLEGNTTVRTLEGIAGPAIGEEVYNPKMLLLGVGA
jgi:hypothetical protein